MADNANDSDAVTGKKDSLPSIRNRAPPTSAYRSEIATIKVGSDGNKRTFSVHRDILAFYSGYFSAALNGGFAEAQKSVINLATEEPEVFEGYVLWLYAPKSLVEELRAAKTRDHPTLIAKLCIFGDRRDIPLLMNEMIDCLQQCVVSRWATPDFMIREVFENTMGGSALRRMIVHLYRSLAGENLASALSANSKRYPKAFVLDLSRSLLESDERGRLTGAQYQSIDMCPLFHAHEEGISCTKKGTKRSADEMEQ